jgi:hypothetical protein
VTSYDVKVAGNLVPRQLDALVEGGLGGATVRVAIECKKYGKPVDVSEIDAFIGKLLLVAAPSTRSNSNGGLRNSKTSMSLVMASSCGRRRGVAV